MTDEHTARINGKSLPISTKQSIEICNFIRGKNLEKAKELLREVIKHKRAIPYKRFGGDVGHKKGKIAAGRYPENACKAILNLLEGVEANAQFKGLNTSNLIISYICPNKASRPWHYGRQRRRKMKRTHIDIIVKETAEKKVAKEKKKVGAKKQEVKKIVGKKKPEITTEKKGETKKTAENKQGVKND
ncbi:50S ribosomal protein L22 [Candidatus Woesearchaeota archaeon]|nr:50S ribosomal protein L22 [Candidatus Woesearchaeota archaeon]